MRNLLVGERRAIAIALAGIPDFVSGRAANMTLDGNSPVGKCKGTSLSNYLVTSSPHGRVKQNYSNLLYRFANLYLKLREPL
jgi:hypothetical protein